MENIAYYNGKISSIEEMTIPMNERSSYFGDGVYDAMFTVDHVPLQLDDHLRRFYRSAKKIDPGSMRSVSVETCGWRWKSA